MNNMPAIEENDVGYALAENVANVKYEDIPADVVEITKKCILDTLGTIIAGSGAGAQIKEVVELVKEGGGRAESSVIGYGIKVPSWMAAFANGAMAHALDYDNVHDEAPTHPTITTLPAALAVAERVGGVNGRELIAAITLGDDLHCRMTYSIVRRKGLALTWMLPVTLGFFSAAAVSAKLLRLDKDKILDAFGIAFNHAGSTYDLVYGVGGSALRGMYAAFPAITGVLAALMAQRGITGIKTCLEGKAGFYNVYFGGDYDRASLTMDLGKVFEGAGVSFKPWPSCRWTHTYIEATLQIVHEHDIYPDDIQEIILFVDDVAKTLCEPLEERQKPVTIPEAKLSLPFTVATAIANRKVVISNFSPDGLKDPVCLQLAQRVTPRYDPQISGTILTPAARVDIKTKEGKLHSKRVGIPYGHPQNPISWEGLVKKFTDCVRYSAKSIPEKNVRRVVQMIANLEEVKDVSDILGLVA